MHVNLQPFVGHSTWGGSHGRGWKTLFCAGSVMDLEFRAKYKTSRGAYWKQVPPPLLSVAIDSLATINERVMLDALA
jgi:hypothetical protein